MAPLVLHASCVAVGDRGLLILGASGAGKSALALQLIALGAALVADDRVALTVEEDALVARCPSPAIRGMIEARGFGLLHMASQDSARPILALDLDRREEKRLPLRHQITLLGKPLPLAHGLAEGHLAAALYCHLKGARRDLGEADGHL